MPGRPSSWNWLSASTSHARRRRRRAVHAALDGVEDEEGLVVVDIVRHRPRRDLRRAGSRQEAVRRRSRALRCSGEACRSTWPRRLRSGAHADSGTLRAPAAAGADRLRQRLARGPRTTVGPQGRVTRTNAPDAQPRITVGRERSAVGAKPFLATEPSTRPTASPGDWRLDRSRAGSRHAMLDEPLQVREELLDPGAAEPWSGGDRLRGSRVHAARRPAPA